MSDIQSIYELMIFLGFIFMSLSVLIFGIVMVLRSIKTDNSEDEPAETSHTREYSLPGKVTLIATWTLGGVMLYFSATYYSDKFHYSAILGAIIFFVWGVFQATCFYPSEDTPAFLTKSIKQSN